MINSPWRFFSHDVLGHNKKALLPSNPLQPSGNHRHERNIKKLPCSCADYLTLKLLVCFTRVAQVRHGNFAAECRRPPNIYKLQCKIGLDKLQCSANLSDPKMFVLSGHPQSIFGKQCSNSWQLCHGAACAASFEQCEHRIWIWPLSLQSWQAS